MSFAKFIIADIYHQNVNQAVTTLMNTNLLYAVNKFIDKHPSCFFILGIKKGQNL